MIRAPSTHTQIPSSDVAVNVYSFAVKECVPVHRTEKLSLGTPFPGPPVPQSLLMAVSHRVNVGVPLSAVLPK
jgi:hypothetical protein